MTVLPSTVCKVISGMIAGSQLSDTALAMASIFLNTSSLSKPTISLDLSAIPKMIFPPVPFAKATTDFIYLILFSGRFSLNSTFFDSPARISSMVIVTPRSLWQHSPPNYFKLLSTSEESILSTIADNADLAEIIAVISLISPISNSI